MTTNVTFKRRTGMYQAGETAGFPNAQAEAIIASGAAVLCKDNPHPAPQNDPEHPDFQQSAERRRPPASQGGRGMTAQAAN